MKDSQGSTNFTACCSWHSMVSLVKDHHLDVKLLLRRQMGTPNSLRSNIDLIKQACPGPLRATALEMRTIDWSPSAIECWSITTRELHVT
ncbi:hypothetical protein RRG08_035041 [Elysia crispata]|uniref:Uncharacterized protein n=1 Tax=Elysia crispata TaxID=231223 RepID=A0AAE0ZU41_9GAST|nr:hypothetical protein RRG08_035041 [Elysia crispata]